MVLRKLHYERGRVARKHLSLFEDDARDDDRCNPEEVEQRRHPSGLFRAEHGAEHQRDDRQLGAARDKGGGHDGHTAVFFRFNGLGGHDAWHAAAGGNQHRDKALSRKAKLAENAVHNERHARHIAAVLQNSEEEKQDKHLRDKAKHSANAADDAVYNQAVEPIRSASGCQPAAHGGLNPLAEQGVVHKICDNRADGCHRDIIDGKHDNHKDWQGQPAVCDNPVDLIAHR